jgi:hypothetical protein
MGGRFKPIETQYKGYRFRSRLEARWAVFFDALGLQWWYEYEGFELSFDVDEIDPEHQLWVGDERQELTENLEFIRGRYLPDFYLPELNYWIEIKPEEPTAEEKEKVLLLFHSLRNALHDAVDAKFDEAYRTREEHPKRYQAMLSRKVWDRFLGLGAHIIYGDIPWPYPTAGNAWGYLGDAFDVDRHTDKVTLEHDAYWGVWGLCWLQCPLCLRIGMGVLGSSCRRCRNVLENQIYQLTDSAASGTKRDEDAPETLGELLSDVEDASISMEEIERDWDVPIRDVSISTEDIPGPGPSEEEHPPKRRITPELFANYLAARGKVARDKLQRHDEIVEELLNLDFFRAGHKTPKLQEAYTAARSARFEARRGRRHGR